ncbi:MAG: hypothetical protein AVDCRST_MAG77-3058 [uncultured Chloroflexi bacterium]|uniref:histidine kinase n=1 Tax=uncultured Chloroflexota bacterium TaxID=166587 RepID=A0A6J4J748_9CHLR|nr:MAG: hypothetical protein AVDCRST_MAG77-3058 [uncultured Chloroflexota bacterium]
MGDGKRDTGVAPYLPPLADAATRVEQLARGGDLAGVARLLSTHRDEVLRRWLSAAGLQPFLRGVPERTVADHIPVLFDALVALLERSAPRQIDAEAPLDDPEVLAAAQSHARERLDQGLRPTDVVTEFRLLRQEIGRALRRHAAELDGAATGDVLAAELLVHDALDGAIGLALAALTAYVGQAVDQLRGQLAERERLAAELARLAAIVESSGDAIIGLAPDGTITSWNAGAARLYGYAEDEAIGRGIDLIIPPDRRGEVARLLPRALAGESVAPYETVRLAKGGHQVDVSVRLSPIRDAAGRVMGAGLIARDIAARKRAEAALRANETRMRAIVDSALDCIVTMDASGRVTEWNPAAERTFGYTRDAAVGQELAVLIIPPALRDAHRRGLAHFMATGEGPILRKRLELTALRADGAEIPVELTITPIAAHGGLDGPVRPELFTGFVRDLSDRKQAEAERNAFLATLVHDVKSPLTAAKGTAQVLRRWATRGAMPPEQLARRADTIDTSISRAVGRLDELLDVARLQAGEALELRREPVDLVELVLRAVAQFQSGTERHLLHVDVPDLPSEPDVPAATSATSAADTPTAGGGGLVGQWDRARLERVVDNLLSNALKYSPEGGAVTVAVWREPATPATAANPAPQDQQGALPPLPAPPVAWAVFSVTDEGIGIPAQDLPHVFDRLQRAGNVGSIPGSGLGLFAVRQIVEQHGGASTVESTEGRGSTFTVRLPL